MALGAFRAAASVLWHCLIEAISARKHEAVFNPKTSHEAQAHERSEWEEEKAGIALSLAIPRFPGGILEVSGFS